MDSLTTIHVKEFRLSKQYIDADSVCSPLCSPSLMTCPCRSRKTAWYLALLDCVAGFWLATGVYLPIDITGYISIIYDLPWGWHEIFNLEDRCMMPSGNVMPSGLCRARAPTCGTEQWALNIFTPQLHTLQMMRHWEWGLEMRLGYKQVELSGLALLEQLHVELNSECGWHLTSTLKLTLSIHWQAHGQAAPTHAPWEHIRIPNNIENSI